MWDVKDDLQRVFDYAFNPDKSKAKTDESQVDDLKKAISYTSQVNIRVWYSGNRITATFSESRLKKSLNII